MSDNIRIMHIASGDLWAGAENVIYQLVSGLIGHSFIDTMVVLLNHGRLEQLSRNAGAKTVVIDENSYSFLELFNKTVLVSREYIPDIIHSHRYKENILASLVRPFCGFPELVTTVHGLPECVTGFTSTVKNYINRFIMKNIFGRIVGVSQDISDHLIRVDGVSSQKVATIFNGIDITGYGWRNHQHKHIVIGSAGRFSPVKNYPLMVDIARRVCLASDNVVFRLAGDGPERTLVEKRIDAYGLKDRFLLTGYCADIRNFYQDIDIFINTSSHEGLPMTVLEAMSYGIPVVSFDVGGLKEIISHGTDGQIVPFCDVEMFCDCLTKLAANPDRLNEMGKRARDTIEKRFSRERMTTSYVDVYRSLVGRNTRSILSKAKSN